LEKTPKAHKVALPHGFGGGGPFRARTGDPLIKSQRELIAIRDGGPLKTYMPWLSNMAVKCPEKPKNLGVPDGI
jgi:hypothetical protein